MHFDGSGQRDEPREQQPADECADRLRANEPGHVVRSDACEGVAESARDRDRCRDGVGEQGDHMIRREILRHGPGADDRGDEERRTDEFSDDSPRDVAYLHWFGPHDFRSFA